MRDKINKDVLATVQNIGLKRSAEERRSLD